MSFESDDFEGVARFIDAAFLRAGGCGERFSASPVQARHVLVLMGAGASVAAGIPDFRSEDGCYARLARASEAANGGSESRSSAAAAATLATRPEALFTKRFFTAHPGSFYAALAAAGMFAPARSPTQAHGFIAALDRCGLLLRCYTQNVDGLEAAAGVDPTRVVQAHGSLATGACVACRRPCPGAMDAVRRCLEGGSDPANGGDAARGDGRHRPADRPIACNGAGRLAVPLCGHCGSPVRPDIVFFDEAPTGNYEALIGADCRAARLLLVVGTSLAVAPINQVPRRVGRTVPRVLVNVEAVGEAGPGGFRFGRRDPQTGLVRDVFLRGDCQMVLAALAARLDLPPSPARLAISASPPRPRENGWLSNGAGDAGMRLSVEDTPLRSPVMAPVFDSVDRGGVHSDDVNGDDDDTMEGLFAPPPKPARFSWCCMTALSAAVFTTLAVSVALLSTNLAAQLEFLV